MEYRQDIQILRGYAVLIVVLFHLGLTQFSSGFIGVDIFFVISGFLMAIIYKHDDILNFYLRRAKRLLPAYFVVVIATLITAFWINTPNEFDQVAKQVFYASMFTSNIGYWLQDTYFSKANYNPLLHLWSLSVEIQFYLFFPVMTCFFRLHKYCFWLLLFLSLILCFFVLMVSPKTAFFLLPFRVWEFLIGYGAAKYFTEKGKVRNSKLSKIGLVCFILLLFSPAIPISGDSTNLISGHPGVVALLVSILTGGVLVCGIPGYVVKATKAIGIEVLGKYSYSIYLVHFPVIVLYLSEPFSGTVLYATEGNDLLGILVITFILSFVSFHVVEKYGALVARIPVLLLAISVTVISAYSLPILQLTGTSEITKSIFAAQKDRDEYRCGKVFRVLNPISLSCELNVSPDGVSSKSILLVGNSHADSIKGTFASVAESYGWRVRFMVSNKPLMKNGITASQIIDEANLHSINIVVLHYSPNGLDLTNVKEFVSKAAKSGLHVELIEPIPIWDQHVPKLLYDHATNGAKLPTQSFQGYMEGNADLFSGLDGIDSVNFKRTSVANSFCNSECLLKDSAGNLLYFDESHLTLSGSDLLIDVFVDIFERHQLPTDL